MTTKIIFAILFCVGIGYTAHSQDLLPAKLLITGNGQARKLTFFIENKGRDTARPVRTYVELQCADAFKNPIAQVSLLHPYLAPGEKKFYTIQFSDFKQVRDVPLSAATTIKVNADPKKEVKESDESNNIKFKTLGFIF